ncbi:MAG: UPF0262 family protein [Alphaproteobacteria bacterium]
MSDDSARSDQRIAKVSLDERTIVRRGPDVEHERAVAIFDLLEQNTFAPVEGFDGPFSLHLSIEDNSRLRLDIRDEAEQPLTTIGMSLSPFRRIIKDYFTVCESYYNAIRSASPSQIEAIDMGRRGLHNEGSDLLRERLVQRVQMDVNTARRLFTLVCVLHIRA